jgi:predicted nucleotidyltransferase
MNGRIITMDLRDVLTKKRDEIIKVATVHGARNIRVFGSVARGEADEKSDIDFLVEMEPGRSLLDLGGLLMDLQDVLGREVDVVTERGLNPRIRERVLKEAVAL